MERLKKFRDSPFLQVGLLALGALCIVIGIHREEAATVLMKAIYICLECIGIG